MFVCVYVKINVSMCQDRCGVCMYSAKRLDISLCLNIYMFVSH